MLRYLKTVQHWNRGDTETVNQGYGATSVGVEAVVSQGGDIMEVEDVSCIVTRQRNGSVGN